MLETLSKILDALLSAFSNRRRLRLRVHRAAIVGSGRECFFITSNGSIVKSKADNRVPEVGLVPGSVPSEREAK
jgi:hypothetical protein